MDKREPDMVMVPREPTEAMSEASLWQAHDRREAAPDHIVGVTEMIAAPSEGGDEPSSPGPAVDREAGVVVPAADFDRLMAACENPPAASADLKARMAAARELIAPPPSVGEGVREADRNWLIRFLERQREAGHCGEGTLESKQREAWNERIERILAALRPDAGGA